MSAMADMSRAIRHVLQDNTPTGRIQEIPTATLSDFVQIVGAFYADLKDEHERRFGKDAA